jgi:hypothetical protein
MLCIARENLEEKKCVICLGNEDGLENYSINFNCKCIGNLFHKKCWEEYKKNFNTCPLCRKRIENIVIEIQPQEQLQDHEQLQERIKNRIWNSYITLNFFYWTIVFSYLLFGILTSVKYDHIYAIACANMAIAFIEIVSSVLGKSCQPIFIWFMERDWRVRLLSMTVIARLVIIIFTMVLVEDSRQVYYFRVGFVMIVVHFSVIFGCMAIISLLFKLADCNCN